MNKISILLTGAFLIGLASCDDAPGIAPVQTNPQPPMYEDSQISCAKSGAFASDEVINLDSYISSDLGVPVAAFTMTEQFPEGAYPSGVLQLSKTEDFSAYKELPVSVADGTGYVGAIDWNKVQVEMFGRAHKEHQVYYRMAGYIHQDGGVYHIGGDDTYMISGSAVVLGLDEGIVISEAYYFLGDCTTWKLTPDETSPFKMYHSSVDPMDDPVFRFYFNISEEQGKIWWKIAPQEAISSETENWDQVLGPEEDGNTNPTGLVVENGNAGNIVGAGSYCIEFNAISLEYNIYKTSDVPYLFTPGGANGWNMYSSQWLVWNDDAKSYYGTVKIDGEVKFVDIERPGFGGASWDNPNYGGSDGVLVAGGGNIAAETGLYWVNANIGNQTYSLTPITTVGLIGVGGDWENDIQLTPSPDMLQWTGKVELSGDWKIRMNGNWDYNYGNSPMDLVFNGQNISGYDGTYNVTVDFSGNLPKMIISE